jgi:hypothetical protein
LSFELEASLCFSLRAVAAAFRGTDLLRVYVELVPLYMPIDLGGLILRGYGVL